MDAVGPCDVAGGRNDPALPTTDDQRLVSKGRIVALLDCGIEGVAIDMRDRERMELRMPDQPR